MRIGGIASSEEYRMDGEFQNLPIFSQIFIFQIEKNTENFQNFTTFKIVKFPLSRNS